MNVELDSVSVDSALEADGPLLREGKGPMSEALFWDMIISG